MNIISKLFNDTLHEIATTNNEIAETAYKVKTGRIKRSEIEIAARGGKGISRHKKYVARKALRRLK